MIYPKNFESKLGFNSVREMLKGHCLSTLGKEKADQMAFSTNCEQINAWQAQTREMRRIADKGEDFPLANVFDMRESLKRVRLQNTWLEENELFDLRRSLKTIGDLVAFLYRGEPLQDETMADGEADDDEVVLKKWDYPALHELADGVATFPILIQQIDQILDKFGHVRDNASPELFSIRSELSRLSGSISGILNRILRSAQSDGIIDKDVTPTLRDGRLMIPVAPGLKRKINGIVHDESASGRTVFVEPAEVVEANNRIRELQAEERQEIIRILMRMAERIRPHVADMLDSFDFLAQMDFIQAKARLAQSMNAVEVEAENRPYIDWIRARHPLLEAHLKRHAAEPTDAENAGDLPRQIVPLDIMLTPEKHILIISGPNAGGKSVCLKTTGLLQYMLQMGLSIPVDARSKCGIFKDIMVDIGDEQSLENDLSTYSSHLLNMKLMMRQANGATLLLIDEFGSGTEPQIGAAIAQSVLEQFCKKGAWGVITTHYQNLKHFADNHAGVANGAMLYDRHEMKPLFQLAIGRPGSSFAIEIARKIGLPEEVIREASDIVGSDYIQSDKYLQDIVRDKRYWEQKRQTIHQQEKELQKRMAHYETEVDEVERQRKAILAQAKAQAQELLDESNRRIESTIREIREQQAEKEATRKIRAELDTFKQEVDDGNWKPGKQAGVLSDEDFEKKVAQINARKKRREERKKNKKQREAQAADALKAAAQKSGATQPQRDFQVGDRVRIKGTHSSGTIESISGKNASVVIGDMRTKLPLSRIVFSTDEPAPTDDRKSKMDELREGLLSQPVSHVTQDTIDDHRKQFHPDLDVRGMRGDEALSAVRYFIDDAILMGVPRVRILHGKGNGILRQLIRTYLASEPNVASFHDEHVQFGGAGITVVDF